MIAGLPRIEPSLFARLPEAYHYTGEPNAWVRMTRPGLRLHSFLEGPAFGRDGSLWLADVPYGRLFRIDQDGGWSLALTYDGEPHGLAFDHDGSLLIADYCRGLLRFDPRTGEQSVICGDAGGVPFRGLADVAVSPSGDFWMTDPGRTSLSDPTGRLYRLRAGQTVPELVLANIPYPNSVALAAGGAQVLVSVTRDNAIWRLLAETPDAGLPMVGTHIRLSGGLGPDGLDIAPNGWLAVAQAQAGRAYLFDALGDPIAWVPLPEGLWTTAVRFAPDGRLFIIEAQTGSVWVCDLSSMTSVGAR